MTEPNQEEQGLKSYFGEKEVPIESEEFKQAVRRFLTSDSTITLKPSSYDEKLTIDPQTEALTRFIILEGKNGVVASLYAQTSGRYSHDVKNFFGLNEISVWWIDPQAKVINGIEYNLDESIINIHERVYSGTREWRRFADKQEYIGEYVQRALKNPYKVISAREGEGGPLWKSQFELLLKVLETGKTSSEKMKSEVEKQKEERGNLQILDNKYQVAKINQIIQDALYKDNPLLYVNPNK